jgi:hypothetical protein
MSAKPIKLAVADTFAGKCWLHPRFAELFPEATIFHHTAPDCPPDAPHPHGGMVASVALLPVVNVPVELHFLRFLDSRGSASDMWLLDRIAEIQPHVWQNSWGQSRDRRSQWDAIYSQLWQPWVERERELRADLGYAVVASAGNDDTGGLGFHDHCHPWWDMHNVIDVGSTDRAGWTTEWSSDGPKLDCVAVGQRRWLLNPLTGRWELGDGTSFSSPAVAGLILRLLADGRLLSPSNAVEWIFHNATRPAGTKVPDPKYGCGSLEPAYQDACFRAGAWDAAQVPTREELSQRVKWLDYREVPCE